MILRRSLSPNLGVNQHSHAASVRVTAWTLGGHFDALYHFIVAKHRKPKTSKAAFVALLLGMTSIGLAPTVVNASGAIACEVPAGAGATAITVQDGSVCEITFKASGEPVTNNTWEFVVPDGVARVSALLVGAGGNSFVSDDGESAAAGGGGEVTFISNLFNLAGSTSRTFNITVGYADTQGASLTPTRTVKVATTEPISFEALPLMVDGVSLTDQDVILVKDQVVPAENGIYRVEVDEDAGTTWQRLPFYDAGNYIKKDDIVAVLEGTQYPYWRLTTEVVNVGIDPLEWSPNWSIAYGETEIERDGGNHYDAAAGFPGYRIEATIIGGMSGGVVNGIEGPFGGEGQIVEQAFSIATGGGDSGPGQYATSPFGNVEGGRGTLAEDPAPRREEHLWSDLDKIFGAGGSYLHNVTLAELLEETDPLSPIQGLGTGGNIALVSHETDFLTGDFGSNGAVIIRFLTFPTPTVTFFPNGGVGSMLPQSSATDSALSPNAFTRDGYTFVGWNTDPLGDSGSGYASQAVYGFEEFGSDYLYAQWIPAGSFLFNKGEHKRGDQQLDGESAVNQPLFEPGNLNIGDDLEINDYIDFYDVTTVTVDGNPVSVGARITFLSHYGSTGNDMADDQLDTLDGNASMDASENNYLLKSELDFDTSKTDGDSFVELNIAFYKDLSSANFLTMNPPSPITLEDVQLSMYDIDYLQFIGIEGDNYRVFLSEDSHVEVDNERTRFPYRTFTSPDEGTSDEESFTIGRATVLFSTVQQFNLMLGVTKEAFLGAEDSEYAATYLLDFGPGLPWGDNDDAPIEFEEEEQQGPEEEEQPQGSNSTSTPTGPVVSYVAPVLSGMSTTCVSPNVTSQSVQLSGSLFSGVTSAQVAGTPVVISNLTAGSMTLALPSLPPGNYDLTLFLKNAGFVYEGALKVCSSSVGNQVPGQILLPFKASKRFIAYRGDRGPVTTRDRVAITNFVRSNPGLTAVTCIGSTSGVPAKASDMALARARAQNACRVVKSLLPDVSIRIGTSVGKGVGQFFRAMTITGTGIKPN